MEILLTQTEEQRNSRIIPTENFFTVLQRERVLFPKKTLLFKKNNACIKFNIKAEHWFNYERMNNMDKCLTQKYRDTDHVWE